MNPLFKSSPIAQQLIDGAMYWDAIGPKWYRLLDRRSDLAVIGSYRAEYGFGGTEWWRATILQPEQQREFAVQRDARLWIEMSVVKVSK